MNIDPIPGVVPAPPEVQDDLPALPFPLALSQADIDRMWRRMRLQRNGVEMPRITSRYARTVLLKDWMETKA